MIKMRKGRESDSEKERDIGGDRANKREREKERERVGGERKGQRERVKGRCIFNSLENLPNGEIKRKQRLITRNYCIMTQNYHEKLLKEIIKRNY